ncbi:MAG: MarR family winged helix-turn-helix transcriptional regulator [Leptospirales bacterium]
MKPTKTTPESPVFILPCACANIRRAARAVTRLYDRELSGAGLEATQFSIVMALAKTGEISQGHLGAFLGLDSTTLSRSLRPLLREGWIRSKPGDDRREKLLDLTTEGGRRFKSLLPKWEQAQKRLRKALTDEGWDQMQRLLADVANAADKAHKTR